MKNIITFILLSGFIRCSSVEVEQIEKLNQRITPKSMIYEISSSYESSGFTFKYDSIKTEGVQKLLCKSWKVDSTTDTINFSPTKIYVAKGIKNKTVKLSDRDDLKYSIDLIIKEIYIEGTMPQIDSLYGCWQQVNSESEESYCVLRSENDNRLFYFQFPDIWGEEFEFNYRHYLQEQINETTR